MKTDMTTSPAPQPSSAEGLAREICNDYFGAPPDGYPEVNPNSKFHLTAILVPLLTPLFTHLQESERVLGEFVQWDKEHPKGRVYDFKVEKKLDQLFELATTHLNK